MSQTTDERVTHHDAHVYQDHVEALKVQLAREPRAFPTLRWKDSAEGRDDVDDIKSDDFEVVGYKPHPRIEMGPCLSEGGLPMLL